MTKQKPVAAVATLLLALLLAACNMQPKGKDFLVDNPLETPITIAVDGTEHQIPALSAIWLNLQPGQHSLQYNGQQVLFVVKPNDQDVVMNPTLSNYVFYEELYGIEHRAVRDRDVEAMEKAYTYDYSFDGVQVVKVPFKLINSLFIERYLYYWDLSLTEEYKSKMSIAGKTSLSVITRSKLFREQGFLNHVGSDYLPAGYQFPRNTLTLDQLPAYSLTDESIHTDCPEGQAALQQLLDGYEALRQPRTKKEYYAYSLKLGEMTSHVSKQTDACGPTQEEANTYTRMYLALGKRLERLAMCNAYVVK